MGKEKQADGAGGAVAPGKGGPEVLWAGERATPATIMSCGTPGNHWGVQRPSSHQGAEDGGPGQPLSGPQHGTTWAWCGAPLPRSGGCSAGSASVHMFIHSFPHGCLTFSFIHSFTGPSVHPSHSAFFHSLPLGGLGQVLAMHPRRRDLPDKADNQEWQTHREPRARGLRVSIGSDPRSHQAMPGGDRAFGVVQARLLSHAHSGPSPCWPPRALLAPCGHQHAHLGFPALTLGSGIPCPISASQIWKVELGLRKLGVVL